MKNLIQFAVSAAMSLLIISCYYDTEYEATDDGTGNIEVSYETDINPLWAADCVSCHNGNEPPNLLDNVSYSELLSGYVVPGDADASILYKSLLGIDGVPLMPPG